VTVSAPWPVRSARDAICRAGSRLAPPAALGELDRIANIDEPGQQHPPWPARCDPGVVRRACEDVGQRHAGEALHREEQMAGLVDPEIVNRNDRRVLQQPLHARFAQKSRAQICIAIGIAEHLDRDVATEPRVARDANLAHAAAPDEHTQRVAIGRWTQRRCAAVARTGRRLEAAERQRLEPRLHLASRDPASGATGTVVAGTGPSPIVAAACSGLHLGRRAVREM
jgi:hypothetical protein